MRYLISFALLVALALPAGAADLRPSAITVEDSTQLPALKSYLRGQNRENCRSVGLPKTCTNEQAQAINPALKIYQTNNNGVEDYLRDNSIRLLAEMGAANQRREEEKDLVEAFRLGTPAQRAAALAALPVLP